MKLEIVKSKKYKWFYWDIFNQCWMWNGEGVKNWREQGFVVKRLPLLVFFLLIPFVVLGQGKTDSTGQAWRPSYMDTVKYKPFNLAVSAISTEYQSIYSLSHTNTMIVPKNDTVISIYREHKDIVIRQSIKDAPYIEVARRDSVGSWHLSTTTDSAMNTMYYIIMRISLVKL